MEEKTNKKEMIEKTVLEFRKLNEYDKMLILGYMLRVQQERQIQTTQGGTDKFENGVKKPPQKAMAGVRRLTMVMTILD